MSRRPAQRGFSLIEVMLALAILAMGLIILVRSVYGNVAGAQDSFYMGIATDLARAKMYDLEELLHEEGFQETEQELEGDFSEEGWDAIKWKATIQPVELPSYEILMGMAQGEGGAGAGTGAEVEGEEGMAPEDAAMDKFQSSALGGMLGMMGMGGGGGGSGTTGSASDAATGGFIQSQYTMVQRVLKESIRKITLTIDYDTGLHKESFVTVLYVSDSAGIEKAMPGQGTLE